VSHLPMRKLVTNQATRFAPRKTLVARLLKNADPMKKLATPFPLITR
jgi:hypothetical protein